MTIITDVKQGNLGLNWCEGRTSKGEREKGNMSL